MAALATLAGVLAGCSDATNSAAGSATGSDEPTPTSAPPQTAQSPGGARPIVYSDVRWGPSSLSGDSIHVGDRVVDTGSGWIHMDVTDDGVVYATGGYADDGRVWFTDGGAPEQIGSHACSAGHGFAGTVVTGNSGSLAAWLDCTREQHLELVVYDTGSGREVARRPAPGGVHAIIGDHVYLTRTSNSGYKVSLLEFDLSTGRLSKVAKLDWDTYAPFSADQAAAARSYADDIRSQRRSLVIGASWEAGTPTLAADFAVVGTNLVLTVDPHLPGSDGRQPSAFDSVTRRPVRLRLPPGYQPDPEQGGVDFTLFEWLDDDTVALAGLLGGVGKEPWNNGDILTCRLSSGRCDLAVPALPGMDRVVPGEGLW
jgi:hypothetical protein